MLDLQGDPAAQAVSGCGVCLKIIKVKIIKGQNHG
jgi:hypothetical protein